MNGAESLVRTLVGGGVDVCFANPGTSEMHFVAALDRVEGMRCVLGLFEGVVTGAADGYYRMSEKPAATLLHLGPGLANGLANIHNANKAMSGMVNLVGGRAVRADGLELAGKIAAKTGARVIAQGSNARTQRGRGRVSVERIPYVVDQALQVLAGLKHIILVGAKMPVAFFAYPDKPSRLTPEGCEGHVLARPDEDSIAALEALSEEVGARS